MNRKIILYIAVFKYEATTLKEKFVELVCHGVICCIYWITYGVQFNLSIQLGENEVDIKSNKYYTLLKPTVNSWMSIEWKIRITMRYFNKSKTQILVYNDLLRLIQIVNHSMLV